MNLGGIVWKNTGPLYLHCWNKDLDKDHLDLVASFVTKPTHYKIYSIPNILHIAIESFVCLIFKMSLGPFAINFRAFL